MAKHASSSGFHLCIEQLEDGGRSGIDDGVLLGSMIDGVGVQLSEVGMEFQIRRHKRGFTIFFQRRVSSVDGGGGAAVVATTEG